MPTLESLLPSWTAPTASAKLQLARHFAQTYETPRQLGFIASGARWTDPPSPHEHRRTLSRDPVAVTRYSDLVSCAVIDLVIRPSRASCL